MTMQTLDPFYIDSNIATSVEFQARLTDYVELINSFPDESTLSNIYWHTDSHSDPITSKIEFFKALNNGTIDPKTQYGGSPSNMVRKELVNKNYRDQLQDDLQPTTDSGGKYGNFNVVSDTQVEIKKKTTTKKWEPLKGENDKEMLSTGKWNISSETTTEMKDVTGPLDIQKGELPVSNSIKLGEKSAWYIMWWFDKFNAAHPVIKNEVRTALGKSNLYFKDFSDSIGMLKNYMDTYDTSTLPVWDAGVKALGEDYSTPSTIAGTAKYIVKPEAMALNRVLTRKTNIVYRYNLLKLMEDPSRDDVITGPSPNASFQTFAHGNNLVTDGQHSSRILLALVPIYNALQLHVGALWPVLDMLSNRENYMISEMPKPILSKVEDFTVAVDLLKNKIKAYNMPDTSATVHSRYGKPTGYNVEMKNDDVLMTKTAKEEKTRRENQTLQDFFGSPPASESSGNSLQDFFSNP